MHSGVLVRLFVCSLGCVLLFAACTDDEVTEVVLVIDADMCTPDEIDAVDIEIVQRSGNELTQHVSLARGEADGFPLTLSLVSKAEGDVTVRVHGMLASERIVTRVARFAFVPKERRALQIHLSATCDTCSGDTTCGNDGSCRPIALDAEELLGWDDDLVAERDSTCEGRDAGVLPDGSVSPGGETCSNEDPCDDGFDCVFGVCANKPWLSHGIGRAHMCSIFDDGSGKVWCRGANDYGQLGVEGVTASDHYIAVERVGRATQVVVGEDHTCVMTEDEHVVCWGANAGGQLGRGSLGQKVFWTDEPGYVDYQYPNQPLTHGPHLSGVTSLALGESHTCAAGLNVDGEVWMDAPVYEHAAHCWGQNYALQLGADEDDTYIDLPLFVIHGNVLRVTAGRHHTCALMYKATRNDDTGYPVACWGGNPTWQLNAEEKDVDLMDQLMYMGSVVEDARLLSTGANHNCIVRADGKLLCWGSNQTGQTGQDTGNENLIAEVPGFGPAHPVVQLATGDDHTCVRVDADAYCFGDNRNQQLLSEGAPAQTHTPRQVSVEGNVLGVWAGYAQTCVWIEEAGPTCNDWPME